MSTLADTPEQAMREIASARRRWAASMRWHDLLFMHWPLPPAALRPLIPPGLELDTFGSDAWIGIVPFRMTHIRARCTPPVPGFSAFTELNVRTYVRAGGRAGVWFFSLDAASRLAVKMARRRFHLPYFHARMSSFPDGNGIRYRSTRTEPDASPAALIARYRPAGPVYLSRPGNLDHWLTERYCLYAVNTRGQIFRGNIQHKPWPLQPAEAEIEENTMTRQIDLTLPATPPILHFSRRLDALAWNIRPVISV